MKNRIGKTDAKLKIVRLEATNFMGLRNIKLDLPTNGLIQVTGKGGAGKSTLLRIVEWLFAGGKAIDKKLKQNVVRRGATRADALVDVLDISDPALPTTYRLTRSETNGYKDSTDVINKKTGERIADKGQWLADMVNKLTFDPLAFASLSGDEQAEELRRLQLASVDLDFEELEQGDAEDAKQSPVLKARISDVNIQLGKINTEELVELPTAKIDEKAIFAKLKEANEAQRRAREIDQAKQDLGAAAAKLGQHKVQVASRVEAHKALVERLKGQLADAKRNLGLDEAQLETVTAEWTQAEADFQAAPSGEVVDIDAVTHELQDAQRRNKLIDVYAVWQALQGDLEKLKQELQNLDDRRAERERLRREAFAEATLPVDGLSFDANQVYYNDGKGPLPLAAYGESDRIRISTLLGIHMNPGLRCMCIQRGESVDEQGLEVIAKLALEHDFQILMARLETSGNIGIVLEDGMVKRVNG